MTVYKPLGGWEKERELKRQKENRKKEEMKKIKRKA
jgi:hypothetical protein